MPYSPFNPSHSFSAPLFWQLESQPPLADMFLLSPSVLSRRSKEWSQREIALAPAAQSSSCWERRRAKAVDRRRARGGWEGVGEEDG